MRYQYKVEVFEHDYTYRGHAPVAEHEIIFDYLTLDKTTITVPKIEAIKGDFATITSMGGEVIYQGIVDDVESNNDGSVTLQLKPLLAVFDTNVWVSTKPTGSVENVLKSLIEANFKNNTDTYQNISGLTVTTTSSTTGDLSINENIVNLYEIIVNAIKTYGVTINMGINNSTMSCTIGKIANTLYVEADLKGIIERNFVIGDSFGELNKLTIINEDNTSQTATYFLHNDGTISTSNTDRIVPVFFDFTTVTLSEGETFADKALAEATVQLKPQEYDNLIELTVPSDSLILPTDMAIGQPCYIIHKGITFSSILTGYERQADSYKMIFGCVRVELIKQLILERRSK